MSVQSERTTITVQQLRPKFNCKIKNGNKWSVSVLFIKGVGIVQGQTKTRDLALLLIGPLRYVHLASSNAHNTPQGPIY